MPAVAGGTQQSTQQTTDEFDPLEVAAARDDQYVNPLSLFVEATQALNWQRERLRDTVLKQGAYMMTGQPHQAHYEEAENKVYNQLAWLTYCRTFYAAKALMSYEKWNRGVGFKLNVKSKIPYPPKKYLMTISTERRGQPVEWMMDLQGTDKFPEDLKDERGVKLLLKHIQTRVKQFAALKRIRSIRESNGDYMVFTTPKPPVEEMTDYTVERSEDAVALLEAIIGNEQQGHIENTIHMQKLGLGFLPLKGEIHPPDNDADVTYNPDRRFKYTNDVHTENLGNISVHVTKNFSARRQWGTFVEMENKNTIDFINNMMPHIGSGWFEVILQHGNTTRLHFKLTPWGEPKTTYVQPFRISSKESPMMSEGITIEEIATQAFDFRTANMEDVTVERLDPYLISGKGNEIDGMVHSIMAFNEKTRRKAQDVCKHVLDTELGKNDDEHEKNLVLNYMRAYYSTDSNGPSGSLCPFGERSIFFFNVQGEIAGVEMSSPSIRVVNQFIPQDYPKVLPRKRDASRESRGEDQEERGSSRRGRFERNARSASRTRATSVMPPPPQAGHVHHVPDAIMEEMRETRNLVQDLVRAMQAGQASQQGQGQNMDDMMKVFQEKFDDMAKQLQHQKELEDRDQGEEKIASFNDSNDEIIILDDIKGWENCVTNEAPEKCPIKIKVSGIPEYPQRLQHEDDELELVKENAPYEFILDQKHATRDGMPVYVYDSGKAGTVMWMFPQTYERPGEFKNPYEWDIWYVTADEKGSDTENTMSVITKRLDANTLVRNGRKEVRWIISHDLQKKLNINTYKLNVRIEIDESSGSVNRATKWLQTVKTSKALVRRVKDTNIFAVDNFEIENKIDSKMLVEGLGGDMYNAQMFTNFNMMPANDKSGMLPSWIQFTIHDSLVLQLYGDGYLRKDINMTAKFYLVDTKEPIYEAEYRNGDTKYRLQIRPYYLHDKKGYGWGLKSDGGEDQDLRWVGYTAYLKGKIDANGNWVQTGYYPQELITIDEQDRWYMTHCWDNLLKISRIHHLDIEIDYDHQRNYKRTPNIPNQTRTKAQEEERYGVFHPLKSEALARMFQSTSRQKIETVAKCYENALTVGSACKFGLFLFHRKFCDIINKRIGYTRQFKPDSVPKHIIMNHTYLQGEKALKAGNAFSEDSYNLFLVDLQGPVWVSVNGEFMICPFANESAKYKTWALWRWDVHKAAYMLFAEKNHLGEADHKHLINEKEFDAKNNIVSKWNFRGRWDGGRITTQNAFDDLRIYIVHDLKQDVRQAPRADGKKITPNLYHLFQRMPDYTVSLTELEFFKSMRKMDVASIERRRQLREERDKQQTGEQPENDQREQAQEIDCAFIDAESGHSIDGEFTAGTVLGMMAHKSYEGKSAAEAGRGVVVKTDTKQEEAARQAEKERKKRDAKEAAETAKNAEQPAPQAREFLTIEEAIEQFEKTRRRYDKEESEIKENIQKIDRLVAQTPEQIERKRINTIRMRLRQRIPSLIINDLMDEMENQYVQKEQFMNQFKPKTDVTAALNEIEAHLSTVANETAKEKTKEFNENSEEDKKEIKKVLNQIVDKCVLEVMIRMSVLIKQRIAQKEAYEEAQERIRLKKIKAEEREKRRREANAQEDAMRVYEADQKGGVYRVDDTLREDDIPQEQHTKDDKDISNEDEHEEEEFRKTGKLTLVEPLIAEVTPWTEIMQLYRIYLTKEKDINNAKAQIYRDKMEKINTQQRMLKEQRESQEREEEMKKKQERNSFLEKKRQLEEEFRNQYGKQSVPDGSEIENALNQCRVFQAPSSDQIPINFKVKIMQDDNGNELACTFILENPLSLRYLCQEYQLKLEPGVITVGNSHEITEYAWKLYMYGSEHSHSAILAIKWKKPGVLMPSSQETNAWRWKISSMNQIVNMIKRKKKETPKLINEYLNEIMAQRTIVWYRGINFAPAMNDLREELLPLFQLRCKPFNDVRTHLYLWNEPQVTTVIENMAISIWDKNILRSNLMKMFEVPTVIFMQLKINRYLKWLIFVMDKNENDISWTCKDLTSMILILQPINTERTDDNSWVLRGKLKSEESGIQSVLLLTKRTKILLDTDHTWTPDSSETFAGQETLEKFKTHALGVLNQKNDSTVDITTEHTNPNKEICIEVLPNGKKVPYVSDLRFMENARDFLRDSYHVADNLQYIRSEANEFDPTAHANFAKLMSKMLTGIMAAGADPTAEISEECEGGLASPRTGARRALGSRAGPPAAVQLLPLQSRKQALQERKRLSVTAPPPRSLPVLSRRLHGH